MTVIAPGYSQTPAETHSRRPLPAYRASSSAPSSSACSRRTSAASTARAWVASPPWPSAMRRASSVVMVLGRGVRCNRG